MPNAYVKKLADKHGVSVDQAEKKWSKAKKLASDQGQTDNYAYVTEIFKSLMHEATVSAVKQRVTARLRDQLQSPT